jgi:glycosyltransferase involved in cell wall biosynthesis
LKPVLFITGHVPASRRGAFEALGRRVPLTLALFGGPHQHGAPPGAQPAGVDVRSVSQREIGRLVASDRFSLVIAGTGGRVALPLALAAARRHRVPFIFWAALWHTPTTPAHIAAAPLMRMLYRNADAIVTYGPHVSAYVAARGAKRIFVAPQAVDNAFWRAPVSERRDERFLALFVGRPERAKGVGVLIDAWQRAALPAEGSALVLVGDHAVDLPGASVTGSLEPAVLRDLYARAHVLVVPSIRTRRFVEPWGLVVNEAMNRECAVIASDAVGAAAGRLVRDGHNGLVTRAGDAQALAGALRRLAEDRAYCARLGQQGREDVERYTYEAWADGFAEAIELVLDRTNAGSVQL